MSDSMTIESSPVLAGVPTAADLGEIVAQVWASYLDGEIASVAADVGVDVGVDGAAFGAAVPAPAMVASVSLSGGWDGHLMIVAGQACARRIAAGMFQTDGADLPVADVADALGEIANMVGGGVKGIIGVGSTLSLPQVVLDASVLVNPDARPIVAIRALWDEDIVEVSVWERSRTHRPAEVTKGR